MKAWEAHKATEEFANTIKWAGEANLGQLWACFYAGYFACAVAVGEREPARQPGGIPTPLSRHIAATYRPR